MITALAITAALRLIPVQNSGDGWVSQIDPRGWNIVTRADNGVLFFWQRPIAPSEDGWASLWIRAELPNFDEFGHLSTRSLWEFDCQHGRTRVGLTSGYKGRNLSGDQENSTSRYGEWNPVAPGSVGEAFYKAACGK